ncbi:MAG TPA: transcriptional regulator [Rhodoblastus sp.]|mgnify:CR=1 FL=1|nr:transcriptional regulator [Rhodoblastus sp.]
MTQVTLCVASAEDLARRARAALRGEKQGAFISFASPDLLWRVLTRKRWDILRAMTGQGALAMREIARRVARDVKGVHSDVHALIDAGVIRRDEMGGFVFPYDSVHVDFTLTAAA